jgi:hypothetical protein
MSYVNNNCLVSASATLACALDKTDGANPTFTLTSTKAASVTGDVSLNYWVDTTDGADTS